MIKEGDKIIVKHGKYKKETGTVLKIDYNYIPECTVLLNKYTDLIPELAFRYFYIEDLEKV